MIAIAIGCKPQSAKKPINKLLSNTEVKLNRNKVSFKFNTLN